MYPLGSGGILAISSMTEPQSVHTYCFSWPYAASGTQASGCHGCGKRGPSHLAEVFGSDPIIITAGKLVHKRQHLVLGPDEL